MKRRKLRIHAAGTKCPCCKGTKERLNAICWPCHGIFMRLRKDELIPSGLEIPETYRVIRAIIARNKV